MGSGPGSSEELGREASRGSSRLGKTRSGGGSGRTCTCEVSCRTCGANCTDDKGERPGSRRASPKGTHGSTGSGRLKEPGGGAGQPGIGSMAPGWVISFPCPKRMPWGPHQWRTLGERIKTCSHLRCQEDVFSSPGGLCSMAQGLALPLGPHLSLSSPPCPTSKAEIRMPLPEKRGKKNQTAISRDCLPI